MARTRGPRYATTQSQAFFFDDDSAAGPREAAAAAASGGLRATSSTYASTRSPWVSAGGVQASATASLRGATDAATRGRPGGDGAAGSVDGKYPERPLSVDGMAWSPYHEAFYAEIWGLAVGEEEDAS